MAHADTWRLRWGRFRQRSLQEKLRSVTVRIKRLAERFPFFPVRIVIQGKEEFRTRFWWSALDPSMLANDWIRHSLWQLPYGWVDQRDLCFVSRFLKKGMCFFDVGAFRGVYAIVAAGSVGKDGKVVAFEPSPQERRILAWNFSLNGLRNVEIVPAAVGANSGRASLFEQKGEDRSMHSLRETGTACRGREVQVLSLDDYCRDRAIDRIDLIKIDVEGGELDVFRGAKRVLEELRPLVLCEISDGACKPWGHAGRDILQALVEMGYRWFELQESGALASHELVAEYPGVRNLLAVPKEQEGPAP